MKKHNKFISAMIIFPSAVMSFSVLADSTPTTDVTLGVGVQEMAKYSGSDEDTYSVLPYLKIQHGNFFLDSDKGIGYQYAWENGLYAGETLGYYSGRKDADADWRDGSDKLKGMGKIKAAINSTSTLGWQINPYLALEGNVIAPLTDSQGMQYNAGLKFKILETSSDTLEFSSKANFGDARYLNTFYGVNNEQSVNSGYSTYRTGSGLYSYDAELTWTHAFSDNWWSYADVTYTQLTSKAKKSPIVKRADNTSVTVGLFYSF
ncbi:MAG: MipA/OmpV family protein [Pantoea sp. Morm]|uniref:MipA/OmpV family protein n=1 Tax=Pantoea sp. Morm TaxID=2601250 RepID=UPI001D41D451|nr:MipA/OmpV family protein [Pantoea sp. Morm]